MSELAGIIGQRVDLTVREDFSLDFELLNMLMRNTTKALFRSIVFFCVTIL